MVRGGTKIVVPVRSANGQVHLKFYNKPRTAITPIKINCKELRGRGIQVLKQFILLGIKEGWWTKQKVEKKITSVDALITLIELGIKDGWYDKNIANQIIKKGYEKGLWKDFDTFTWRFDF